MPFVPAAPNFERQGVIAGFVLRQGIGLTPFLTKGVLFAQGTMYRPDPAPTLPMAPASQQSWLWYNSSSGFYWTATPVPTTSDDALIGWAVTDAERAIAFSRQLVAVPEPDDNVTVIPLGSVRPIAEGSTVDSDVPPAPVFGLAVAGKGQVELVGMSFGDLTNTNTISSARLMLHYWNELSGPSAFSLAGAIGPSDTTVDLNAAGPGYVGAVIQIGAELLVVDEVLNGGLQYVVTRASFDTTAGSYSIGEQVDHLDRKVFIIPFSEGFFGTPDSGDFTHRMFLPNARVAAAEMMVKNLFGYSESTRNNFTGTVDYGLRTMAGGQVDIQVDGVLGIQSEAAAPVYLGQSGSIGDIWATVAVAPTGAAITIEVKVSGVAVGTLTIADGATTSNVIDGRDLDAIAEDAPITIDITGVGSTFPGERLVVRVRL